MVYFKNLYSQLPERQLKQNCEKIIKIVKQENCEPIVIEYGSYKIYDFKKALQSVDFVVVFQDNYIETQGLAIAEMWAENKPTFVNYQKNEYGGLTAPYLCTQNGFYYKNFDDLRELIRCFYSNESFRDSFSPSLYVKENMSDEISVSSLIRIFNATK